MRRSYVPYNPDFDVSVELLSTVPVVAAALGPVAGLGAARVAASHFSVMVQGTSQLFVAGPPVVRRAFGREVGKEELGGSQIHARGSGAVDNEAASEDEAFAQIRRFLSYLPAARWTSRRPSARRTTTPSAARRSCSPSCRATAARSTTCAASSPSSSTADSVFEIGRCFGRPLVTALARLDGVPVGVMANDPRQLAGSIDADAAQKMIRFVDLCDTFRLPVVNFVDNPGFLIGVEAEKRGTIRHGVRALTAVYQATRAVVLDHRAPRLRRRRRRPRQPHAPQPPLRLAERRVGLAADRRRRRGRLPPPDRSRRRPRRAAPRARRAGSPRCARRFLTAEAFGIEEIIDPRETRPLLVEWVRRASGDRRAGARAEGSRDAALARPRRHGDGAGSSRAPIAKRAGPSHALDDPAESPRRRRRALQRGVRAAPREYTHSRIPSIRPRQSNAARRRIAMSSHRTGATDERSTPRAAAESLVALQCLSAADYGGLQSNTS